MHKGIKQAHQVLAQGYTSFPVDKCFWYRDKPCSHIMAAECTRENSNVHRSSPNMQAWFIFPAHRALDMAQAR